MKDKGIFFENKLSAMNDPRLYETDGDLFIAHSGRWPLLLCQRQMRRLKAHIYTLAWWEAMERS